jgi:hypothetical protein
MIAWGQQERRYKSAVETMERVRGSEGRGQPRGYKAKEGHTRRKGHGRGTGENASLFCNSNDINEFNFT